MRLTEIASEYAREPRGTLVISPDNESRRELNALIHREMQERGDVSREEHKLRVLDSRQEMTGHTIGSGTRYYGITSTSTPLAASFWRKTCSVAF